MPPGRSIRAVVIVGHGAAAGDDEGFALVVQKVRQVFAEGYAEQAVIFVDLTLVDYHVVHADHPTAVSAVLPNRDVDRFLTREAREGCRMQRPVCRGGEISADLCHGVNVRARSGVDGKVFI